MTFLDLQTLVGSWLDDRNFGYFTLAEVKVWINNGQKEVQKRLLLAGENYYVKQIQTTLRVASSTDVGTDYVLPDDFLKEHRLEIIVDGTAPNENVTILEPITINQTDLYPFSPGLPVSYYLKKNRISIWPPPDSAKVMRMHYSYLIQDMSLDVDLPDVPTEYQEFIAVLATLDGFYKDNRDPAQFLLKKAYYEKLLEEVAEDRRQDQSRHIVITRSDGFETLF